MSHLRVLIHGATGTQGAPFVRAARQQGHDVIAASRRGRAVDGAESVALDLTDAGALAAAYQGVDAVVVQLPLEFGPVALDQAQAVLSALDTARVPRAVLSAGGPILPEPVGVPYLDARLELAAGLPSVVDVAAVVGPAGPYMENLSIASSAALVADGVVASPLPAEPPVPWVALADVAAVVVETLTATDPAPRRVVTGPAPISGLGIAEALSSITGRDVVWRQVRTDEYRELLVDAIGPDAATGIASFYADEGPPPDVDPATITAGRTDFETWARSIAWT